MESVLAVHQDARDSEHNGVRNKPPAVAYHVGGPAPDISLALWPVVRMVEPKKYRAKSGVTRTAYRSGALGVGMVSPTWSSRTGTP
jgi:hypothetical protein